MALIQPRKLGVTELSKEPKLHLRSLQLRGILCAVRGVMRVHRVKKSTLAVVVLLVSHIAQDHDSVHAHKQPKISGQRQAERIAVVTRMILARVSKGAILRS